MEIMTLEFRPQGTSLVVQSDDETNKSGIRNGSKNYLFTLRPIPTMRSKTHRFDKSTTQILIFAISFVALLPRASIGFASSISAPQNGACPRLCECRRSLLLKFEANELDKAQPPTFVECLQGEMNDTDFLNILQTLPSSVESIEIRAQRNKPNSFQWNDNINKFAKLRKLVLVNCGIPAFSHSTRLPSLRELDLQGNKVAGVQIGSFMGTPNLERLSLAHNQISVLPSGAFIYLKKLRSLSLAHNRLTNLATSLLRGPLALEELALSGNLLSSAQLNELFVDAPGLIRLELNECGLNDTEIWKLNLGKVPKVKLLGISGNNLTKMPSATMRALESLSSLDLSNNFIKSLGPCAFCGLNLRGVFLQGNFLGLGLPESIHREAFAETKIVELDLSHNQLSAGGFSSKLLHDAQATLETLHLSGNGFGSLDERLVETLPRLTRLHLAQNQIDSVPPNLAGQYTNLVLFNLSGNALETLPSNMKKMMPNLAILDISNNKFRGISDELKRKVMDDLGEVHLHGNPWICDCTARALHTFLLRGISESSRRVRSHLDEALCAEPKAVAGQPIYKTQIEDCLSAIDLNNQIFNQASQILLLVAILLVMAFLLTCAIVFILYCGSRGQKGTYITGEESHVHRHLKTPMLLEAAQLLHSEKRSLDISNSSESSDTTTYLLNGAESLNNMDSSVVGAANGGPVSLQNSLLYEYSSHYSRETAAAAAAERIGSNSANPPAALSTSSTYNRTFPPSRTTLVTF